jgi:hypothetical protein
MTFARVRAAFPAALRDFTLASTDFPALDFPAVEAVTLRADIGRHHSMSYAKRILVQLTTEQDAALRSRLVTLGVPVAEQIRRAVNLMLFADAKPRKKSSTKLSAEQPLFQESN